MLLAWCPCVGPDACAAVSAENVVIQALRGRVLPQALPAQPVPPRLPPRWSPRRLLLLEDESGRSGTAAYGHTGKERGSAASFVRQRRVCSSTHTEPGGIILIDTLHALRTRRATSACYWVWRSGCTRIWQAHKTPLSSIARRSLSWPSARKTGAATCRPVRQSASPGGRGGGAGDGTPGGDRFPGRSQSQSPTALEDAGHPGAKGV